MTKKKQEHVAKRGGAWSWILNPKLATKGAIASTIVAESLFTAVVERPLEFELVVTRFPSDFLVPSSDEEAEIMNLLGPIYLMPACT
jgi:hypothetical protein